MTATLSAAHEQWSTRPVDQRFHSMEDFVSATEKYRTESWQARIKLEAITIRPREDGALVISGKERDAELNHWSFGQISKMAGAPAGYLRSLRNPELVAENLNYGLKLRKPRALETGESYDETEQGLLLLAPGSNPQRIQVRALTGVGYGRIWNVEIARWAERVTQGTSFRLPPAYNHKKEEWPKGSGQVPQMIPCGAYASDHDCFLFLADTENRVEVGNRTLGRGFFLWNSEVGAKSFQVHAFLMDYVCGNHYVWGANTLAKIRMVHVGEAAKRAEIEVNRNLVAYLNQGTEEEVSVLQRAMNTQVAKNDTEAITYLREKDFTKREANESVVLATRHDGGAGSLFQLVSGLTRFSQTLPGADERTELDTRAGRLLKQVS